MEHILEYITSFESLSSFIVAHINSYSLLSLCIVVFLFGEFAIFTAILLAQQDLLSIHSVLIAATVGTIAADIFWFMVGRYYPKTMIPLSVQRHLITHTNEVFTQLIAGRIFITLLLLRFFIGTRIFVILYFSRYKISWPRFLLYDMIGTIIYILILYFFSVLLGEMIHQILPSYQTIVSIISGILCIALLSLITKKVLFAQKRR